MIRTPNGLLETIVGALGVLVGAFALIAALMRLFGSNGFGAGSIAASGDER